MESLNDREQYNGKDVYLINEYVCISIENQVIEVLLPNASIQQI